MLTLLFQGGADTTDELVANSLSAGAPTLGTPSIAQIHAMAAATLASGAPTLGTPVIGQAHVLAAVGLAAGAPTLDSPEIEHIHVLQATGLSAGAADLGEPVLDGAGTDALTASDLAMGAPTLGEPVLAIASEEEPAPPQLVVAGGGGGGMLVAGRDYKRIHKEVDEYFASLGWPVTEEEIEEAAQAVVDRVPDLNARAHVSRAIKTQVESTIRAKQQTAELIELLKREMDEDDAESVIVMLECA